MISLMVYKYCDCCPDFKPVSMIHERERNDDGSATVETRVQCKHADRCWAIERHIRMEIKMEMDEDGQRNE